MSAARGADSGSPRSWLMGPELPAHCIGPAQTGSLGNSSLVFPSGAVEQHHQAGVTPVGLGSEEVRLGCPAAVGGEHHWVLRM